MSKLTINDIDITNKKGNICSTLNEYICDIGSSLNKATSSGVSDFKQYCFPALKDSMYPVSYTHLTLPTIYSV